MSMSALLHGMMYWGWRIVAAIIGFLAFAMFIGWLIFGCTPNITIERVQVLPDYWPSEQQEVPATQPATTGNRDLIDWTMENLRDEQ